MTDFYLLFTKTRTMDRNLQYIKKVWVEISKSTCLQRKKLTIHLKLQLYAKKIKYQQRCSNILIAYREHRILPWVLESTPCTTYGESLSRDACVFLLNTEKHLLYTEKTSLKLNQFCNVTLCSSNTVPFCKAQDNQISYLKLLNKLNLSILNTYGSMDSQDGWRRVG